jgi:uncharacterized RDD family membrane protein YckC
MLCPGCGQETTDEANFCPNCGYTFKAEAQPPGISLTEAKRLAAVHYAGFWRRFVALFIDEIVVSIVVVGVEAAVGLLFGLNINFRGGLPLGTHLGPILAIKFTAGTIIHWLYWAGMESSVKQATLGKMALGIIVTDLQGEPISFARATGRYFGKFVSAVIFCIGFMMAGWTVKKQALHDLMAGTLVVLKKQD